MIEAPIHHHNDVPHHHDDPGGDGPNLDWPTKLGISSKSAKYCIYQQNQQNCAYPQVEMGLTWIDHDVIEVPVEEIEVGGQRQIISFF